MNNEKPKISVIMATFNSAETLQRALDSYASQNYPYKELIVIDGASKDDTVNIIRKNESFIDYWISECDSGIYEAWNKGLDHVTGDWVYFLGSDDRLLGPDVFEKVVPWLEKALPQTDLVYGAIMLENKAGEPIQLVGQPWNLASHAIAFGMPVTHPGTFHRYSSFQRYGKFDESFQVTGDLEFCLRVLKDSKPEFIWDTIITAMTFGGKSSDRQNELFVLKEGARARAMNGIKPYPIKVRRRIITIRVKMYLAEYFGQRAVYFLEDLYCKLYGVPKHPARLE